MLSTATKARLIKLSAAMMQQAVLGGGLPTDVTAQLQALSGKVRSSKPAAPTAREREPKVLSVPQ